ncbi:MAG: hypothetical protein RL026_1599 [Pseudomonadota bacterium]|jgi:uncharacterized protein YjeT (DUF2065 family)
MQWSDLLAALALMFLLEGLLPFISPARSRRAFERLAQLGDRELRVAGLAGMGAGLLLLFIVRS